MIGKDFIDMMHQDIVTENSAELKAIVFIMEQLVAPNVEIKNADKKTPQDCYKSLFEYARSKKKNGCYCMTYDEAKKLVSKYLELDSNEIKQENNIGVISLEDLL